MLTAYTATTAKERAIILAAHIRSGRPTTRASDSCLEMGDGDEVLVILRQMAQRGPKLAANWSRYLSCSIAEDR